MLGIDKDGNQNKWEVALTFALVLVVNILNMLPEGKLPNLLDVYIAIRHGLITALTLYLVNKGIKYRKEKEKNG